MNLGELIEFLRAMDQTQIVVYGICNPHTYVDDESIAFDVAANISVGEMLAATLGTLDLVFTKWKDGQFTVTETVLVYLATADEEVSHPITQDQLQGLFDGRKTISKHQRSHQFLKGRWEKET